MTVELRILKAGPNVTIQDLGRPGLGKIGLSRGGALDRLAILEAAAILGLKTPRNSLELGGIGGQFSVSATTRIALTGAPMRADIDGVPLKWSTSHVLSPDQTLNIGSVTSGTYGYLTLAGGFTMPELWGSQSAHLASGLGRLVRDGHVLTANPDDEVGPAARTLAARDRFSGGMVRFVDGPQSELFEPATRARFEGSAFARSAVGNRQGARLDQDGAPFTASLAAGLASDVIICGDIQMTGDGVPYVLLAECQTIGGYPRIGTVIPADTAIIAQAPAGAPIRFRKVNWEEADRTNRTEEAELRDLRSKVRPLIRDPRDIPDLLGYQLVSGVVSGTEKGEG